jgi:peptidoglycan hydrolase-like protein with peptidoglycan-binding domain
MAVLAANPAFAADLSPDAINSAEPSNKSLTEDNATPAGVRLQVLLDRAHFSPGEIDGKYGGEAFRRAKGLGRTRVKR